MYGVAFKFWVLSMTSLNVLNVQSLNVYFSFMLSRETSTESYNGNSQAHVLFFGEIGWGWDEQNSMQSDLFQSNCIPIHPWCFCNWQGGHSITNMLLSSYFITINNDSHVLFFNPNPSPEIKLVNWLSSYLIKERQTHWSVFANGWTGNYHARTGCCKRPKQKSIRHSMLLPCFYIPLY